MPRRSERLRNKAIVNNAPARKKIDKYVTKRTAMLKNEFVYVRRLQYAHEVYNALYKNFYVMWTHVLVRPSCLRTAYLHIKVLRKNLHATLTNKEEQLSDQEMEKIQGLYRLFRKFRQLYEYERHYLFNNVLRILPKLNPDVVAYIDEFI